jgi:hypothetical protein
MSKGTTTSTTTGRIRRKLGYNLTDNLAVNVVDSYTDSTLNFTGDDFVDFFPLSSAEPIQSTQIGHQFAGRAESVWSPYVGFKSSV